MSIHSNRTDAEIRIKVLREKIGTTGIGELVSDDLITRLIGAEADLRVWARVEIAMSHLNSVVLTYLAIRDEVLNYSITESTSTVANLESVAYLRALQSAVRYLRGEAQSSPDWNHGF